MGCSPPSVSLLALNLAPSCMGDAAQKYSGGDGIDSLSYDRGGVPVGVQYSKVSQCSEHGNADTTAEVKAARIGPGTRGEDEVAGRTDGPNGCSEGTLAEGILAESGLELEGRSPMAPPRWPKCGRCWH